MNTLQVGFSRHIINPPLGIPVIGLFEKRYAKEILDDITVSAVAFDDGKCKAAIISADHLYINTALADQYRAAISKACALPMEAIFLAATHTHGGPSLNPDSDMEMVRNYTKAYGETIIRCVKDAIADCTPAQLYTAVGQANDISYIRRYFMKDGRVRTNPDIGDPNTAGPVNDTNNNVNVIRIDRDEGNSILMVNFGVHPCSHAVEAITADFPHFLRQTLEGALPNTNCIFLTAFEGDVGCTKRTPRLGEWDVRNGYKRTEHMGRYLAGSVLQACTLMQPVENTNICYGSAVVRMPSQQENDKLEEARKILQLHKEGRDSEIEVDSANKDLSVPGADMDRVTVIAEAARRIRLENGPEHFDYTVSAVRVGDIVFAGVPGEPFTEIGTRIIADSPYQLTFLCCCTNGGSTYFPSSAAYEQGGYEPCTSNLRKGCDNLLVDGLSQLIRDLKQP